MNAAQVIDLVNKPESLTGRGRVFWIVILTTHVDALCGAHTGAEFAPDALLHAVFITVQHMSAMEPLWLGTSLFGILRRDTGARV